MARWWTSNTGGKEDRVSFLQVIQYRTSKYDEMKNVADEWEADPDDAATSRRVIVCRDRDNDGQYFTLVFFDSYESAMENSNAPRTQEMSQKMMALADGPPTFYNFDVVEDREM
jgi:hypothetical protein